MFSSHCIAFVSDDWPISHDGLLNLSSSASIDEEEKDEETKPKISTSASAEFFFISSETNRWFRLRSDRYFIRRVALKVSISEFKLTVKLSNLRNLFWTTQRKNKI